MEKLLTSYLFQYKVCPLPSLGTLYLHTGYAGIMAGEKKIVAPSPSVSFEGAELSPEHLFTFISTENKGSKPQAVAMMDEFCNQLKNLSAGAELKLGSAGTFYKNEELMLAFRTAEIRREFMPSLRAERVIRADVAHHMVVGDTETDTTAMNQRLNSVAEISRSRWWIAAVIGAALALGAIVVYVYEYNNGMFGNAQAVEARSAAPTYHTGEK